MDDDIDPPEIRFLGDLQRLRVEPGDLFVLQTDQILSCEQVVRLRSYLEPHAHGAGLLVLSGGMRLGVISTSPIEEQDW